MSSFQVIRPRSSNPNDEDVVRPPLQSTESSVSVGKGRKRKAPAHVSQNACTNCKKARAKCDGVDGQTCSRCNSRGLTDTCNYELHVKTAKEELVRKIKHLESTVDSLRSDIKERDHWIASLKHLFDSGTPGSVVLQHLSHDQQVYNELTTLLATPPPFSRHTSGHSSRDVDSDDEMDTDDEPTSQRWTNVTQDDNKIHHLMALYFSWVHPVHMFFSERHFMDSFRSHSRVYCSPALVNAICAMGCRYWVDPGGNEAKIKKLGDRFTQQALIELKAEKVMNMVSTVTYAIMFLVELGAGRARHAFSHLRLAADSLRDIDKGGWSAEAFQVTLFGVHALNVNWAALTYQKPPDPTPKDFSVFEQVELDRPGQSWHNYKVETDAANSDIPTYAIEVAKEFAKLSLIHLDAITAWCGSAGKLSSDRLLRLYRRYLAWRRALSRSIGYDRDDYGEDDVLPFVLMLHINFCVSICQLFSPLLECRQLPNAAKAEMSRLTLNHAWEGLKAYEKFARLFSNRYQTPLQAFCLVHLADVIIRQDRSSADQVIQFCLQQLGDALPGFAFIGPLQAMFCETVLACGLELPKDIEELMGGRSWQSYSREDKLGCSERLTYGQPVDKLAETIDESLPETWEQEWEAFKLSQRHSIAENDAERHRLEDSAMPLLVRRPSDIRAMDINSIMNP